MNTKPILITIPGNPVTKKNSQQIAKRMDGSRFILPSSQYRQYELYAKSHILKYYADIHKIEHPVNLRCLYYKKTRNPCDLVNLLEATCDILVRAGVLKDDNCNIVVSHDGSRVLYDKDRPRTEIYIESVKDSERIFSFPSGEQGGAPPVKPG